VVELLLQAKFISFVFGGAKAIYRLALCLMFYRLDIAEGKGALSQNRLRFAFR
jgi:hypothetical protein